MAVVITQTANPAGVAASSNIATYSSVAIGDAAPNRIIVVLVGTELASSTPSACTIDYGSGDTAMNAGSLGNFGALYARAYYLLVPTGTTATIKVTYSATNPGSTANHIAVYKVLGANYSSASNDGSSDMDSTDPLTTGSITIPANGGFIAVAAGAADTVAKAWANASEDLDVDAGTFRFTTATRVTALTTTAVTVTGTTNGEDGALSYIIFTENVAPTVVQNTGDVANAMALIDDFNDNSLHSQWTDWGAGNTNETNNRLEIATNTTTGYFGINSTSNLAFTGKVAVVELVSAGNQALTSLGAGLVIEDPDLAGNQQLAIIVEGGTIYFRRRASGSNSDTTATYNTTNDRWLRIRESGGTVYMDTSADGITWTNRRTTTSSLTSDASAKISLFAGTWQNEGVTSTIHFDNLNVIDPFTTTDTTPTLEFTGTDADGNDIRFQVDIDPLSTFDSSSSAEALDQSNTSGAISVGFGDTGNGRDYMAMGFIPTVSIITAISFRVQSKDGSSNIGYLLWIDAADSNFYPTGTVNVGVGGVTEVTNGAITTGVLVKHTLTTPVNVTPGNRYVFILVPWNTSTDVKVSSYHDLMSSVSNPYANGRRVHLDGSFANPSAPDSGNADIHFEVYGQDAGPLISALSGTDSGFANPDNGGDTDPFTSGENIQYTVQAGDALSLATYYTRVRPIDPSGSNGYGSYATRRITVAASSLVKTALGLARASVKTMNGLAIASVKSKNGLQ